VAKAIRVTQADVDDAESALIAALTECRALVVSEREGKTSHARTVEAKAAVEVAERDLWFFQRKLGEANVKDAAEQLGATIEWGPVRG
jgi:acetoacetate decarboxylase